MADPHMACEKTITDLLARLAAVTALCDEMDVDISVPPWLPQAVRAALAAGATTNDGSAE